MDGYNDSNYPDVTPERDGKRLIVQPNTFNMYCHREPRFYLTVVWNGQWFKWENRNTNFLYGQPDGGPTHDAPQNGYLNRSRVSLDIYLVITITLIVRLSFSAWQKLI